MDHQSCYKSCNKRDGRHTINQGNAEMKLKLVYLLLAIAGAIIPFWFFLDFGATAGIHPMAFIAALFVNGAAGGFTADLLISSVVFWVFLFSQQSEGPKPWLFIGLNLCIGLSCALPAYLYARAK